PRPVCPALASHRLHAALPILHAFDWPLEDLLPCIDSTPFFQAWELAGKYPAILQDPVVGPQASELFRDAQAMLARIVAEKWLARSEEHTSELQSRANLVCRPL